MEYPKFAPSGPLFNPDSILNVQGQFQWPQQPTDTENLRIMVLERVNDAFETIEKQFVEAGYQYRHSAMLDGTTASTHVIEARQRYVSLRREVTEGWLAARYFHFILSDLERGKMGDDMLVLDVPDSAAVELGDEKYETLHARGTASEKRNCRTYWSGIPGILRRLQSTNTDLHTSLSAMSVADSVSVQVPHHRVVVS